MSEVAVLSRHNVEATTLGSILIIDDESAIRESLETLLEFEGYSVQSAETGEQGLARVGDCPFDLVLQTERSSLQTPKAFPAIHG